MDEPRIVEGQPRSAGPRNNRTTGRYGFTGTGPYDPNGGVPKLQFGDYGELTPRTIAQAGLVGEERKLAMEMLKVQAAFIEIYTNLDYPNDPEGHVVDLSGVHMTQPKVAIAWTLALLGFRSSGKKYIKKRAYSAPGVVSGAYTWVDVRAPDDAAEELTPQMSAADYKLPPDTRRLAALRDGEEGQKLPSPWTVRPEIVDHWVCRDCGRGLEPGQSCPACAEETS